MRRPLLNVLLSFALVSCGRNPEPPEFRTSSEASSLAAQLNSDLARLRQETEKLSGAVADLYARREEILPGIDRSKYGMAEDGTFHKLLDDGGATLWISGAVPITEEVTEAAYFTEPLDRDLIRITREFPEVSRAWFIDRNSLVRGYPWFDAPSRYPPKMNMPESQFYWLADERHDPNRGGVWMGGPWLDPSGRGWMVGALAPVYQGDRLAGVAGVEVAISTIVDRYFKSRDVPMLVVVPGGEVVAATEKAIELLEMPPLRNHRYLETVRQNTFSPDEYNVTKSPAHGVREMASALLDKFATAVPVELAGRTYTAVSLPVPETGWKVVEFVAK